MSNSVPIKHWPSFPPILAISIPLSVSKKLTTLGSPSTVVQMVKHLPPMRETWVRSLGQEDLLEKEKATHCSTLAWKIPWTESTGLQRVGLNWVTDWTELNWTECEEKASFVAQLVKNSPVMQESACNTGDLVLITGLGRSPWEGNGNPLQYSCLGNSMDKAVWRGTVHGVEKQWDMT